MIDTEISSILTLLSQHKCLIFNAVVQISWST